MPVLPVNWHEELGARQREHQLEVSLTTMAGHVNLVLATVEHVGASAEQVVDRASYHLFIARDRVCRKHNGVTFRDLHEVVFAASKTGQATHGLALSSGRDNKQLVLGDVSHLILLDEHVFRHLHDLDLAGHFDGTDDAPTVHEDLATLRSYSIHDLLNPVDVAGERTEDDTALGFVDNGVECRPQVAFRTREARLLGVRRVGQKQEYPLAPKSAELLKVDGLVVDWSLIDLVVARVKDDSLSRADSNGHALGHRMGNANELDIHFAYLDAVACLHCSSFVGLHPARDDVIDDSEGELAGIDRCADMLQRVTECSDVIHMRMSDEDSADLVLDLVEVVHVGDDIVDPLHVIFGELEPRIDNYCIIIDLINGYILANLPETSKGSNADDVVVSGRVFSVLRLCFSHNHSVPTLLALKSNALWRVVSTVRLLTILCCPIECFRLFRRHGTDRRAAPENH